MTISRPTRLRQLGKAAMTRLDLLAALAGVLLLSVLVLPILAATHPKVEREQCRNNLRLIGKAFRAWAKDHDRLPPWRLTLEKGGTFDLPGNGNAWAHLAWLSNHLYSPKLLACPADRVNVATSWTLNPKGGFIHAKYRANALSYFVGLDVQESAPKSLLSGDHNLQPSAIAQPCDYANVNNAASLKPGDKSVAYTAKLHGQFGNVLFQDGQVTEMNSEQLRQALPKTDAVHEDNHILLPR